MAEIQYSTMSARHLLVPAMPHFLKRIIVQYGQNYGDLLVNTLFSGILFNEW
jgi:hypothetical protein